MKRRHFLQLAASAAAGAMVEHASALPSSAEQLSLRIAPVTLELAPGIIVRTTGYNDQSPGPVLRMREGVPVTVSITNATEAPESVQWHGLHRSLETHSTIAGSGSMIAPRATRTYTFTPAVSGTRWYHSPSAPSTNSLQSANSGKFGFLLIEPRRNADAFDKEVLLAIHHWEPTLSPKHDHQEGQKIAYRHVSFNDKLLGANEPIRVRAGERVLFRFLNASQTEEVQLHLPGHRFTVIALDGNPVPKRAAVDVLSLTVGERIDAIVEMNSPGKWLLGSVDAAERARGLGICVEYANHSGAALWSPPAAIDWSYARFSASSHSSPDSDQPLKMLLEKSRDPRDDAHHWIVDGRSYSDIEPLFSQQYRQYRLQMMNATSRARPIHLHGHQFELTRVNQIPVAGIFKDTIRLERYNVVEANLVTSYPHPRVLERNSLWS
jgi:FtsP/CotA-like multicopper oxidase with cupredoxin domain